MADAPRREQGEAGPRPVSPDELKVYFESIGEAFRETRKGMSGEPSALGLVAVIFFLSLFPVIPYVLSSVVWRLAGKRSFSLWTFHIPLASFWFWWVVSFLFSLALLVFTVRVERPTEVQREGWLSPPQMRFALCYATASEVRRYRTSRIPSQVYSAVRDWKAFMRSLVEAWPGMLPLDRDLLPAARLYSGSRLVPLFTATTELFRPRWYKVVPETELILRGFEKLLSLEDRLKDRKDLGIVEGALTDLAAYFYTEIPDIAADLPGAQDLGMQSLLSFARQMESLAPYIPERPIQNPEERLWRRLVRTTRRLGALFGHQSPLVSFAAWYALMLLLFLGGFYVAHRLFPSVRVDSTIITAIVGGPIATAITAVTILPLLSTRKGGE